MPEEGNNPTNPLDANEESHLEASETAENAIAEEGAEQPFAEAEIPTTEEVADPDVIDPIAIGSEVPENLDAAEALDQPAEEAAPEAPGAEVEQTAPETPAAEAEVSPETNDTAVPAEESIPEAEAEESPAVAEDLAPAEAEVPAVPEAEAEDSPAVAEDAAPAEAEVPATPEAEAEEAPAVAEDTAPAEEGVPETADAEASEGEDAPDDVAAASNLLADILGDEANFEAVVEKSNPQELALLMDRIAESGDVGEFISKVGLIKRSFDKKTDGDATEIGLLSRFNTGLSRFNKKRTAYYAEREKEKEENSRKKYELLERLKEIVAEEQVTKIQEVRVIQNEWREIGWVLQQDLQPLNETYKQYLDLYYGLRSKYRELLELDRRYNLEEKMKLVGEVESLIPEEEGITREDWNRRSQRVKDIQELWRSVGHVPRENVDDLNAAWRDTLDRFFEMRSSYYELQDQQRGDNALKKKELLGKLEKFASFESGKARAWNDATKEILAIQEEWKKIGPGPLEENKQLWKDYRAACDSFFTRKGEYFKIFDEKRTANLEKKIAICEKAESLQDAENWKETAVILKALQEEWKTIGAVHERHSNKVWKRFRKACDHFFERRSEAASADRKGYQENLVIKEGLIARVREIVAEENPSDFTEEFQEIQAKWKATGHVPFKVKDKVNNAFREVLGEFYDKTRTGGGGGRNFRGSGGGRSYDSRGGDKGRGGNDHGGGSKMENEVRKIENRIRGMEEKVTQYEINIQYISKGKSGQSLREQIQKQIDDEKKLIADLKKKRKELKHKIANPPAKEEKAKPEEEAAPPAADTEAPAAEKTEAPAVEAEAPAEETPAAEADAPAEEAPAAEAEAPAEEAPAVEVEAPAKEAPAAEAEAPAEETPAEEAEAPSGDESSEEEKSE